MKNLLAILAVLLAVVITPLQAQSISGTATGTNVFYFTSSVSSPLGQGSTSYVYETEDLFFDVQVTLNNNVIQMLSVNVYSLSQTDTTTRFVSLQASHGMTGLVVGQDYQTAFSTPGLPILQLWINNKGDSSPLLGTAKILELTYDGSGNVTSLAMDFSYTSENGDPTAQIMGSVRYNSDVPLAYQLAVPEPSSIVLSLMGGAAMLIFIRRRRLSTVYV